MKDFIKTTLSLGIGALVVTKENAEKLAKELIKRGELNKKEANAFIQELIKKGEKSKKEIRSELSTLMSKMIDKLNIPTRKEITELKAEIKRLKKQLNK